MNTNLSIYLINYDQASVRKLVAKLKDQFEIRSFDSVDGFLAAAPYLSDGCVVIDLASAETSRRAQDLIANFAFRFSISVLVDHRRIDLATAAVKCGAKSILLKPVDVDAHLRLVKAPPDLPKYKKKARSESARSFPQLSGLSPREREVLDAIAEGLSSKMAGHKLSISARTVEFHRSRVMRTLGARNVADMVRIAIEAKLASTAFAEDM